MKTIDVTNLNAEAFEAAYEALQENFSYVEELDDSPNEYLVLFKNNLVTVKLYWEYVDGAILEIITEEGNLYAVID